MDYGKTFEEIANECSDIRAVIIIGILQSIRDNRPIDRTVIENMLYLAKKQTKSCLINYTVASIKSDIDFDQFPQNSLN